MSNSVLGKKMDLANFFEIRLMSIAPGVPLSFDIYLYVNGRATLFRKRNDILTKDRVSLLLHHGGETFLVPEDQRALYLQSLKNALHNPSTSIEQKGTFIKETAFLHVKDLFTKPTIKETVESASHLIEEMVSFVSSDVGAIASLMKLSVHDYYTYNHCVDVAVYSIALAKRIYGDDRQMLMTAGLGGLLHDVGKRKVDASIINKKGALNKEEWEEIKKHPTYGREYLDGIGSIPDDSKLIVFEHHENFDGTGYPSGLKGEDISKLARVVAIADVFDALTTDRAYHKAIPPKEALDTMFGMQPGKFDPTLFQSFNKNFSLKADIKLDPGFDPCQVDALTKISKK